MRFYLKLSACVVVVIGYAVGLWVAPFSVVTFLLGIPVCNWLANLFHELGHLLAYRLLKLEWKRMVLSFWVIEKGKGISLDRSKRIFDASCTCAYSAQVSLNRYRLALLSGGAVGLLMALGTILAGCCLAGPAKAFLLCFGIVSGLNGGVNLLVPLSPDRVLITQIKEEREKSA